MAKKKVLLVDDEQFICDNLKSLIERIDCEVFVSMDSGKALKIFQDEKPEVCIIDIHMSESEYDGVELLRRIREIDKDVKCIMLTCVDESESGVTKDLNVAAYFEKPLCQDGFKQLLDQIKG
ncbi:MAG: response regulator [Candidatus Omnitrophica bacterium]|nr:response regulator [Candidatus Omnitrophota bacterium]